MSIPAKRIFLGQIGAPHGIKGAVRITTHTQHPEAIGNYGPLQTDRPGLVVELSKLRLHKNVVVAYIKGIADRNAAAALNGVSLYVERSKFPENEDEDDFYHADLVGLEARCKNGRVLGEISAVHNFGAGDLIEVYNPQSGDTSLYPFTKAVVPTINIADGYLVIALPHEADDNAEKSY